MKRKESKLRTTFGFANIQLAKEEPQIMAQLEKSNCEVRPPLEKISPWEELLIGVMGCLA